jgi:hypothetical protein
MKKLLFLAIVAFSSCSLPKYVTWDDNVTNPDNKEVLYDYTMRSDTITQEDFNKIFNITRKDMSFYKNDTLRIGFIQVIRTKHCCCN